MGQPTPPPATDPGATPPATDPAKPPATPPANNPAPTDPAGDGLGDAGKKALETERAARKELEKRLAALEPLTKLADALGVKGEGGKNDVETLTAQVTKMQVDLDNERLGRLRLEVAAEKSLTPAQAARLVGASREELAKDADALKELFPATAASGQPGTPAPDPSQGARGGINDLQAALKAAQTGKNTAEVIRLKTAIAAAQSK
jgi:hypothetical protein